MLAYNFIKNLKEEKKTHKSCLIVFLSCSKPLTSYSDNDTSCGILMCSSVQHLNNSPFSHVSVLYSFSVLCFLCFFRTKKTRTKLILSVFMFSLFLKIKNRFKK